MEFGLAAIVYVGVMLLLLIFGGYVLGYGFRKGWDRAGREAARDEAARNKGLSAP
jgi:hypothetical protein